MSYNIAFLKHFIMYLFLFLNYLLFFLIIWGFIKQNHYLRNILHLSLFNLP